MSVYMQQNGELVNIAMQEGQDEVLIGTIMTSVSSLDLLTDYAYGYRLHKVTFSDGRKVVVSEMLDPATVNGLSNYYMALQIPQDIVDFLGKSSFNFLSLIHISEPTRRS